MKILTGGSLEVEHNKWKKFDVELDESDIQALVVSNGLDYAKLTVVQKYTLLVKQAEVLVAAQMSAYGGTGEKTVPEFVAELKACIEKMPKVED